MTDTPDNAPLRTEAGDSPTDVAVPLWVTACVRLHAPAGGAADKAITAAQVLLADRIRVYGRDRAVTTHEELAEFLGYARRDKVKWVVDYLERIGFLAVPERREAEVDKHGRRKPRRDEKNRTVGDTFLVHERAPAGYIGPRTLHELREALKQRRQWSFDELFVDPSSEAAPSACTPEQVQDSDRLYPGTGTGNVSAGHPCTWFEGEVERPYIGDPSGISLEEIPEGGSAASPASAGADAAAPDWARALVRRLPWSMRGRGPTVEEAGELAAGFQLAHHEHGLSQAEVQDLALRTLARADKKLNPVRYVIGAFERSRLERLRPAGEYEPLAEQPLPLPEESPSPESASSKAGSDEGQRITIVQSSGKESAESAKTPAADPSQHMALIRESLQRRRAEQARQNQRSA